MLIEGSYLVPAGLAAQRNEDVDSDGAAHRRRRGSAYDLFLTREIKQAQIVRVQGAQGVMESLHAGQVEVAAGIRQVLEAEAAQQPGLRLLPGRFMVIQQAMGTPASRGGEAGAALGAFVEEMKASGFVADALARHRIQGASVAPAGREPASARASYRRISVSNCCAVQRTLRSGQASSSSTIFALSGACMPLALGQPHHLAAQRVDLGAPAQRQVVGHARARLGVDAQHARRDQPEQRRRQPQDGRQAARRHGGQLRRRDAGLVEHGQRLVHQRREAAPIAALQQLVAQAAGPTAH